MKKLAWILFGSLSVLVSLYPIKYLITDEPIALLLSKTAELVSSNTYTIFFYLHITLGGVALMIGWLQFSKKLRKKYLKVHRAIGKIYVAAVLISAPAGLYISFFATAGLSPKLGFSIGAVFWFILTYLGYNTIRKGNVTAHKKFMMYSYAGTFGAVTLRVWLPVLILIFGEFTLAYQIVAWLSWIPNMFVVYLILNKKESLFYFYKKFHIKKIILTTIILVAISFLVSFASPHRWFYKSASYEGKALQKTTVIASSSFTQDKLNEIDTYLKEESETTSMMVIENGKIIFEYGDVSEISNVSSTRTSILTMLYGKYIENGNIDLQETIGNIGLEEDYGLLPIEKKATVNHLITAKSGVFLPIKNHNTKKRGSVNPGEYFIDDDWDFNAAGYVLEKKSGNTIYEELEQQLALPLGFEDWNIENQSKTFTNKVSRYPEYNMHLSTRDMAKIGQLMLQNGRWNDNQLIAKEWIQKITSTVTSTDTVRVRNQSDISSPLQQSYGYMWWVFDRFYDNPDFEGAYTTWGDSGQFITVIPKRNVVVAHKTTLDALTHLGFSDRAKTPSWRYWWILRNLMLNRKSLSELSSEKTTDEMIEFIKNEYQIDSKYAISERLINEFGQQLADKTNCEDAIKFFELNLELYPPGYYTHRTLDYYGNCLIKLGRNSDAIKAYKKSMEFNPENGITQKLLLELKTN